MDAEEAGVMLAWEHEARQVALDSKSAIERISSLSFVKARSWIEEEIQRLGTEGPRRLSWVRGHTGIRGNEEADTAARRAGWIGSAMQEPEIATPAGIRHYHPLSTKRPQMKWDRDALRGLTYVHTDRGPMKHWLRMIGRSEAGECECGAAQNAVHILVCTKIGDGRGRKAEEIWKDEDWCREVARFVRR